MIDSAAVSSFFRLGDLVVVAFEKISVKVGWVANGIAGGDQALLCP